MKKEPTIQVNWRLPASLVGDLKEVAEQLEETQTEIVREGILQTVSRKKRKIERRQEKTEGLAA